MCHGKLKVVQEDFPGGPVMVNPPSNATDTGSIPGWGTKTPRASTKTQCSQKKKK